MAGEDGDAGLGDGGAAQDPLEGGAPAGDHHEVVVAGFGRELHLGRQTVAEAHFGGPFGEQRVEDVGLMVTQQVAQASQKGVTVADLGRATAIPLERLVGGRRHRRVVTLDDRHLVARPPELERRGQARNTATDHHDLHRRKSRPSKSPQLRHASM